MKYLAYTFLFVSIMLVSVQPTYAAGRSTAWLQLVQDATSVVTQGSTFTNTGANVKEMITSTVLKPLGDSLIQIAQQEVSNNIISWAAGGFEGQPLIITDPGAYIERAGLSQVKLGLGNIPEDSTFGDSIFNSILATYKGSSDVEGQLKSLSKSSLPGLIKDNVCSDAALTSLAMETVQRPDGSYDPAALSAKKTEIYNYACIGDPATDSVAANRLQDFAKQRPELLGAEGILAITQGDNDYVRSIKGLIVVSDKVDEEKKRAENEIYLGAGPVSQRKCLGYAPTYAIGQVPECEKWQVVNPGELIQGTLEKALNAPLDRLASLTANGFTDGAIASILSSFAMSAVTRGISNALSSASGSTPDNSPIVLTSRTAPSNDLVGDPLKKQQYTKITNNQFSAYRDGLNKLFTIDTTYINELTSYEGRINTGKSCYTSLVTDEILLESDTQFINANNFYQTRLALITPTKTKIEAELSNIRLAFAYIAETEAKITATNSSEEVGVITTTYLDTIEARGYPSISDYSQRKADYSKDSFLISEDEQMTSYQNTCNQVRQNGGGGSGYGGYSG